MKYGSINSKDNIENKYNYSSTGGRRSSQNNFETSHDHHTGTYLMLYHITRNLLFKFLNEKRSFWPWTNETHPLRDELNMTFFILKTGHYLLILRFYFLLYLKDLSIKMLTNTDFLTNECTLRNIP